ncbi:Oidioi.mRNA.OKI2018_I69.chr1.g3428.t1.cds [Oikopleura dioica]|uniref:Oidioi.mRNA.OKI2018_I69.chr1.g3428.t1.cds n=1 Tax=Oikopleura dioica TaxID=34765 RepID=A0ABN7SU45_OIKDI|nr:Oidioi.mRNA.OKI2018_I69.chr1.g3428.t1.cds [Oikopleura dioica]
MRLDFTFLLSNIFLVGDVFARDGDVDQFLQEMEDVFDLYETREEHRSPETVNNLRKLWEFFKATESNYIMEAFPRQNGSFDTKRSAQQQRLEKRGASQYYLLHFGLPGQKGGRRRFRGRMPV